MADEPITITIPNTPEMHERLDGFAEVIRSGGFRNPAVNPVTGKTLGAELAAAESYFGPNVARPQVFMHPDAARQMGPAARQYLGARLKSMNFASEPGLTDVHVDSILTEMSIGFKNQEFIGGSVFPRVQVDKVSDKFFVFDAPKWRRDEGTAIKRGLSARPIRVGWDLSTDNYNCERYTVENAVDDLLRRNADAPINVDRNAAELVTTKLDLRLEKEVAALVFTAANWTSAVTLAGANQWSDPGSNIFGNFSTARLAIRQIIGFPANTLVLGVQTFETIALNGDLLDRIKYTGTQQNPAAVTAAMMAQLFMVDRVLVGAAVENTAAETLADTQTLAFIWGKHAWLGYVAPAPARENPSAGYTFTMGRIVDRYREDETTSDVVRANEEWAVKKTAAGAGYLWTNATS